MLTVNGKAPWNKGKTLTPTHIDNRVKQMEKHIIQYTKDGVFVREWKSASQVKAECGFHQGHISEVCLHKRKSANGYVWEFKNKN